MWPKLLLNVAHVRWSNIASKTLAFVHHFLYQVDMDFVLGRPRTFRKHDSIFVVVDHFSKIDHFIPCSKTFNVSQFTKLYFNEIIKLYGFSKSTISDRDVRFMSYF